VANAFLDGLAHARRAGGLTALSVGWGAWDSVGMARRVSPEVVSVWQHEGADLVSPRQALRALEHLMGEGAVHVAVLPLELTRMLRQFMAGDVPPYLSELARAPRAKVVAARAVRPTPVERDDEDRGDDGHGAASGRQRRPQLSTPPRPAVSDEEKALVEIWQEALDLDGIGVDDSFFELGGHSLVALQIVSRIRTTWGVNVPLRLMFDTPTVRSIAAHVRGQRQRTDGATARGAPAATVGNGGVALDVDALSDADADALLTTLLERR
jgi:acyl carrier protein